MSNRVVENGFKKCLIFVSQIIITTFIREWLIHTVIFYAIRNNKQKDVCEVFRGINSFTPLAIISNIETGKADDEAYARGDM